MAVIDLASRRHEGAPAFDYTREANHRISNQLAVIAGMVNMQAASVAKGPELLARNEVRGLLRETAGKIASIAHLHRRLAQLENIDRIEGGDYLIECCAILASSIAPRGRVGIVQQLDRNCFVTSQQAQSIGLIVNEVMTNAVKHAHPTGIPVEIHVACHRAKDGAIEIEIQDDGIGLPEGFDPRAQGSVGFKMIRSLAASLDAVTTLDSDSLGTLFRLLIPAEAQA